jgi:hypothetical protein
MWFSGSDQAARTIQHVAGQAGSSADGVFGQRSGAFDPSSRDTNNGFAGRGDDTSFGHNAPPCCGPVGDLDR